MIMVITLSKLHNVLGQRCCYLSELQSQLLCCLRSLLQLLPNTTDTLSNQVQVSISNTHWIKPNQLLLFTVIHIFHPTPQPKELSFIFHKASKMAKKPTFFKPSKTVGTLILQSINKSQISRPRKWQKTHSPNFQIQGTLILQSMKMTISGADWPSPSGSCSSRFWERHRSVSPTIPLISSGSISSWFSDTSRMDSLRRLPISWNNIIVIILQLVLQHVQAGQLMEDANLLNHHHHLHYDHHRHHPTAGSPTCPGWTAYAGCQSP